MKPDLKPGCYVEVKWMDAFSVDEWTHLDDALKVEPCLIVSVGIMIQETDSFIAMAVSHDTVNDNYSCIKVIPNGMINSIRELK